MKSRNRTIASFAIFAVAFLMVVGLTVRLSGQQPQATGLVDDWSHHHVVFSNPGAFTDAVRNGTAERWLRINSDPRFHMQQLKRSNTQRALAAAPDFAARVAILNALNVDRQAASKKRKPTGKDPIKKDWSTPLASGNLASLTCAVGSLSSGTVSGSSTVTVDGVVFHASPPTTATGSITVGASYCFAGGDGVAINGINITTNATKGTGTVTVNGTPGGGITLTIGGTQYLFHGSITSCGSNANCIDYGTNSTNTAQNIVAAVNDDPSKCGYKPGTETTCFYHVSAANAIVSASDTTPNNVVTLTSKCAGVITLATSGNMTFAQTASNGTTSGTNFALPSPPLNTTVASNMKTAIAAETSTDFVTASATGGVVSLTGQNPGSTDDVSLALYMAPTGLTLSGSALTGGTDGTTNGTATPPTFAYWSGTTYATQSQVATNIATAVNANTTVKAVITATANSPSTDDVTFTAYGTSGNSYSVLGNSFSAFTGTGGLSGGTNVTAAVQPNAYPATFANAGTCSDFAVYPTGQAGSSGAATIIAYNNMYVGGGCGSTNPTVYWAYNTGNGYSVTNSPILSIDGSKVAFVQSNGTAAQLVVLLWAASTGTRTSPGAPTSATNITTCTAPCMTVTPLTNNDTYSSPFYDFLTDDALYVGDDTGNLEQFTGVFNGPISGPTTIALGSSPVASPAYDYTSGCVFAGDTEGYLYQVNSGTAPGTICTSGTYGLNATSAILGNGGANEGIFDAPLVDSTAGEVYVFVTDSAAITATGTCAAGDNCVAEFPTSFLSGAAPGYVEPLGAGGVGYNLYTGTFDNVWFNSSNSTGNLYAVGNTATVGGGTLYGVTLTNGLMAGVASAVTGLNSAEYPWPSPATEFCNGACTASSTETTSGTDYLFFSVNRGAPSGCSNGAGNGCILSYNINNPSSVSESGSGLNVTTPGTNGCWASGGLVVDNMAPTTGASQIYFVNLNGADAGGPAGQTSTNCTAGTAATINGVQAAQSNP